VRTFLQAGVINSATLRPFEDQGAVSTTKAEGVTQRVLQTIYLTGFVRNEIQIATLRRVIQVDGRRNSLVAQCKDRVDRLYRARRTQQVPVMDLVELTIMRLAASPNTDLTACASALSPAGVDVPWAFTHSRSGQVQGPHHEWR
jgi:GTP1/Obg family GTP-binding protein